ncbi:MAG TPA: hypothetical protein PK385_02655 [Spirochaetota bacterium]|jgi:predicted DNA-binding ribbon-helix-helix protein|nr:MAG: hypothetical protein BWX91_02246 [Spirochaetes bacterium ADurb.Bin133]HNZ27310.1 hypothetical protein [Spirochaetota bacterium]HOF02327.1 hypothetical protein [Spirochaetota bacterium]HOS34141.1 hypothetical protein [Spirochaetota bacterium]HOS54939.1 hypothetical protein [Spirochaetota bacterium]
MSGITISLDETRYAKLANIANQYGKSIDALISEIIDDLPEKDKTSNIIKEANTNRFNVIKIKTKNFKFDREKANAR